MKKSKTTKAKQGRNLLKLVPHRSIGGVTLPGYTESLEWETYLERAGIQTIHFCHDITDIRTQQETFEYVDEEGITRKYTPDITFSVDKVRYACEVKPLRFLMEPDVRNLLKHANRTFVELGYRLTFLSDDQLYITPQYKNIKLLFRYKNHHIESSLITDLIEVCKDNPTSFSELENIHGFSKETVFSAIARKQLFIDFHENISPTTLVHTSSNMGGLSYVSLETSGKYGPVLRKLVLEGGQASERLLEIERSKNERNKTINKLGFF